MNVSRLFRPMPLRSANITGSVIHGRTWKSELMFFPLVHWRATSRCRCSYKCCTGLRPPRENTTCCDAVAVPTIAIYTTTTYTVFGFSWWIMFVFPWQCLRSCWLLRFFVLVFSSASVSLHYSVYWFICISACFLRNVWVSECVLGGFFMHPSSSSGRSNSSFHHFERRSNWFSSRCWRK